MLCSVLLRPDCNGSTLQRRLVVITERVLQPRRANWPKCVRGMQGFRVSARLASQVLMRAKPKKGKAATGEVFVAENPMQDKLNGMYLKALESPRRPKP